MTRPPEQPFDEEGLLRALRSPGSASELGEEERYAAMFREARDGTASAPVPLAPRRRRMAGRFGAGSAFVVVLAVGGSAAAAYTNNLPEPIQRFAHQALGPVAPPAPEEQQDKAKDRPTTAPTSSTTPTPSSPPTETPSPSATASASPRPTHKPSHPSSPTTAPATPSSSATASAAPTPTAVPTQPTAAPTPTETPTASPTSTPTVVPPAVPASVTISGSTHKVETGQSVAFAGVVTAEDGSPVRRARVTLQMLSGGRWVAVGSARTDVSGAVSLVLPPISATTRVRLRTPGVHSSRWRVTLHPSLTVTSAAGPDTGTVVITATAVGAQPGDTVLLLWKGGQATGALSGDTVTFAVTPATRRTTYVVALAGTTAHGPDKASITVVVTKPVGSGGNG